MTRRPTEPFALEDGRDDLPFQIHFELDMAPLSVWAFRVYAHLVRRGGRDGKIFPSYQSIGEACFRATYGPEANPRSLRNKAMAAMKELVDAGLVIKTKQLKKGTGENETNTYTLTPRRQWLEEMKQRQATLVDQTEQVRQQRRSEAEGEGGGTPTMPPPSTPTMPGGTPTMPKVSSIKALQSFEVDSKEEVVATSNTAVLPLPEITTTFAQSADQQAPNGAAAEAAKVKTLRKTSQDTSAPVRQNEQITATETVPAGGAPDPEATRAILQPKLGGASRFQKFLTENPPSGVKRGRWLSEISPARAAELVEQADTEIRRHQENPASGPKPNLWTVLIRLLDMEIGWVPGGIPQGNGMDKRPAEGTNQAAPRVSEPEPDRPADTLDAGSRWEHKRLPDEVVTLVAVQGTQVELHNGKKMPSYLLTRDYQRVH